MLAILICLIELPYTLLLWYPGIRNTPNITAFAFALAVSIFIFGRKPGKPTKWMVLLWAVTGTALISVMVMGVVGLGESVFRILERISNWWPFIVYALLLAMYFKNLIRIPREEPTEENEP